MRSVGYTFCVLALATACGSGSAASSGGGGSGAPADAGSGSVPPIGAGPADSGTSADAGAGSTPPGDAGTGIADAGSDADAGAVADAGSSDAGAGGSDGGTASTDCDGLVPSTLPATIIHSENLSQQIDGQFCGVPQGNGHGFVAYAATNDSQASWTILSPTGTPQGTVGAHSGDLFPAPSGFIGYGGSSASQTVAILGYDDVGTLLNNTPFTGDAVYALNPNGGLFAAGQLTPETVATSLDSTQVVFMFNADGSVRYGPVPLGTNAAIFGAGVDRVGLAVVILDGTKRFGPGAISAIWFDAVGARLTPEFEVLHDFVPGVSTWFETSALAGSGLALRRMDTAATDPTGEILSSRWLALLPSGSESLDAAPAWLRSRPNTNLKLVRGGRAYALFPWAALLSSCEQTVEILSPSGASCGKLSFVVDGKACTSRELRIGFDGTVMQMLPTERETDLCPVRCDIQSCTVRYWPAALR